MNENDHDYEPPEQPERTWGQESGRCNGDSCYECPYAEQKKRHGCLTAVLVLTIVANSATALMYLFGGSAIKQNLPGMPSWALVVMGIFAIFNLVCSIALFKWKKWGFWGWIVSSVVALFVNLSVGLGIGQSLFGLGGIALLYGVLHIGKENKGWPQLD